jgi:hypothetical protein
MKEAAVKERVIWYLSKMLRIPQDNLKLHWNREDRTCFIGLTKLSKLPTALKQSIKQIKISKPIPYTVWLRGEEVEYYYRFEFPKELQQRNFNINAKNQDLLFFSMSPLTIEDIQAAKKEDMRRERNRKARLKRAEKSINKIKLITL